MGVVFAKDTVSVAWSQGKTILQKGEAWDSDADLVREKPDLFAAEPAKLHGRRVERATRAPGEVRTPSAPASTPARPRGRKSTSQQSPSE